MGKRSPEEWRHAYGDEIKKQKTKAGTWTFWVYILGFSPQENQGTNQRTQPSKAISDLLSINQLMSIKILQFLLWSLLNALNLSIWGGVHSYHSESLLFTRHPADLQLLSQTTTPGGKSLCLNFRGGGWGMVSRVWITKIISWQVGSWESNPNLSYPKAPALPTIPQHSLPEALRCS